MYTSEVSSFFRRHWVALVAVAVVVLVPAVLLRRLLVIVFRGTGMDPHIPAEYRTPPSIEPSLAEHSQLYAKKVHRVGEHVYCAVGYGIANIVMLEGDGGIVIVDTGETLDQANEVLAELRKITTKPVAGVVLTHHHADHVFGTSVFAEPDVPVFAHRSLMDSFAAENSMLAELQTVRSVHMYGATLGLADRKDSNVGIGPFIHPGETGFMPPTRTFDDHLDVTVAGIRMEMRWVPSEADSEIAVWLPDWKTLLSAEVVQDHGFPNLYTIRGARFRDPMRWVSSIDLLRSFDADFMVLQHGPPVVGHDEVARTLTVYRDQIQYVHDQTIRHMNHGLSPAELANVIRLPEHLDKERPWTGQFYGTVKHSVRGIYAGNVGWFGGDPVDLDPTPPVESAKRLVALMGGRDRVLAEAKRVFAEGDSQYAAELTTYLIRIDKKDMDARHVKAAAFRKLGYAQISAPWRNYYLVSAMELEDQVPESLYVARAGKMLGSALKGLPADRQVATLSTRLKAEETLDVDLSVGIHYTDVGEDFTLHLRRGVLEVSRAKAPHPMFALDVTRVSFGEVLAGKPLDEAFGNGAITVTQGDAATAQLFFAHFEPTFVRKPEVVLR